MLQIKTTGVEDYLDGSANIKMLVLGPAGVGKTRMASFWPKPIYADVEGGRGSLVDRKMPYVEIKNSKDMLDFLAELKRMEQTPKAMRPFQTVVIDTLDGFQRKVKDEWLLRERKQTFTGYEAWGFLDSQMQMLMTRLLNLDYNVVCACHVKDKVVKKGDEETHELMLHLQGDVKDTATYDFDLVAWLGSFWAAEDGERVEKRGLSFKKTPDRPFLKDRFGIMPSWVPITLTSDQDFQQIFDAFLTRIEDLPDAEVVGEIPDAEPEETIPTAGVMAPAAGPLPPVDPKDVPLTQHDKPTLAQMARDLKITTTVEGSPIRANTLKGELIAAIEAKRAEQSAAVNAAPQTPEPAAKQESNAPPATPAEPDSPAAESTTSPAPVEPVSAQVEEPAEASAEAPDTGLRQGEVVDPGTGEITHEQAIENAKEGLGGEVVSDVQLAEEPASAPEPAPAPAPPAPAAQAPANDRPEVCEKEGCNQPLAKEVPQYVQLSFIKFKQYLCNEHYLERRRAA